MAHEPTVYVLDGRMTVRAVVTDPASIARLLGALRRSRDPPVAA